MNPDENSIGVVVVLLTLVISVTLLLRWSVALKDLVRCRPRLVPGPKWLIMVLTARPACRFSPGIVLTLRSMLLMWMWMKFRFRSRLKIRRRLFPCLCIIGVSSTSCCLGLTVSAVLITRSTARVLSGLVRLG